MEHLVQGARRIEPYKDDEITRGCFLITRVNKLTVKKHADITRGSCCPRQLGQRGHFLRKKEKTIHIRVKMFISWCLMMI